MSKSRALILAICVSFLIFSHLHLSFVNLNNQDQVLNKPKPILKTYSSNNSIWISMGLCYDQKAKILGKEKYPYAEVTPLAIKLWKHFRPDVKIYIKIIYTMKNNEVLRNMYNDNLLAAGADEIEWADVTQAGGNMSCVLQSQVSRLFLYQRSFVKPDDVIVTVDVNLFVMKGHILEPIDQFSDMNAWIFQYEDTAHVESGNGETFNQNLLGLRAKTWKLLMNATSDLNEDWIRYKRDEIGLGNLTWYYDQWITTHGLLLKNICTVPPWSGLWNKKGLEYDPYFDDSNQCWHGRGYKDCNMDIHIVPHGCKWWHFYPSQTFKEHVEKFNELTENSYNLQITDIFSQNT